MVLDPFRASLPHPGTKASGVQRAAMLAWKPNEFHSKGPIMSDAAFHAPENAGHGRQPSGRALATFVSVTFGFSWLAWLPLVFSGPTMVMP